MIDIGSTELSNIDEERLQNKLVGGKLRKISLLPLTMKVGGCKDLERNLLKFQIWLF
jgi:hypothetical protein